MYIYISTDLFEIGSLVRSSLDSSPNFFTALLQGRVEHRSQRVGTPLSSTVSSMLILISFSGQLHASVDFDNRRHCLSET